jgi:hypothetical protein
VAEVQAAGIGAERQADHDYSVDQTAAVLREAGFAEKHGGYRSGLQARSVLWDQVVVAVAAGGKTVAEVGEDAAGIAAEQA